MSAYPPGSIPPGPDPVYGTYGGMAPPDVPVYGGYGAYSQPQEPPRAPNRRGTITTPNWTQYGLSHRTSFTGIEVAPGPYADPPTQSVPPPLPPISTYRPPPPMPEPVMPHIEPQYDYQAPMPMQPAAPAPIYVDNKPDKNLIAGLGLLCVVQNYGFFGLFWDLWSQIQEGHFSQPCFWMSRALGWEALNCFLMALIMIGMVTGGWIQSKALFGAMFGLHLIACCTYTAALVVLGDAVYNESGSACFSVNKGVHSRVQAIWITSVGLYLPYMVAFSTIMYQCLIKPKKKNKAISPTA